MRFLTLKPGVSVNVNSILAVERLNENESIVFTANNQFESVLPYETVLLILADQDDVDDKFASMEQSLSTLRRNSQIFGG